MKKGQIIEGMVQRVDFPCKGIVETADGICIVKNTLPGQKIRCAINKVRKGKAEGRLLEIIEPAPMERESPCPHYGICGSCVFLSLPYEEQLKIKEAQVKRLLDSVLYKQGEYQFEGIKPSPICYGYRNKMEFSFGDEVKDGPLTLGMHKRGSFYDIVSVDGCQIVDEDYRQILQCVRGYFMTLQEQGCNISFYHRLKHTGYLRHLLVRKAAKTGEILIALITTTQTAEMRMPREHTLGMRIPKEHMSEMRISQKHMLGTQISKEHAPEIQVPVMPEMAMQNQVQEDISGILESGDAEARILEGLTKELLHLPLKGTIVGILHTKNDALADVVRNDETDILYGQDFFYEELLGLKFKISQFSFFQTNSLGAEVLYETAREYILDFVQPSMKPSVQDNNEEDNAQQPENVGADAADQKQPDKIVFDLYSGTGTIAQLMAPVAKKVIGVEIVEEAVEAAKNNAALNGLHNCEFIAGDVLKVIDEIEEKPDIIILDPPRDGIHPKALNKIIQYGAAHILYISCKPTSLARDLEALLERGYRVDRAVAVDMFPGTGNVETIVLLSKGENQSKKIRVGCRAEL